MDIEQWSTLNYLLVCTIVDVSSSTYYWLLQEFFSHEGLYFKMFVNTMNLTHSHLPWVFAGNWIQIMAASGRIIPPPKVRMGMFCL